MSFACSFGLTYYFIQKSIFWQAKPEIILWWLVFDADILNNI
jgi:hypothetical protein